MILVIQQIIPHSPQKRESRGWILILASDEYHNDPTRHCTSRRLPCRSSDNFPIEHALRFPMLDFDDPDIRIPLPLTGYVSIRIGLHDRNGSGCPHP